MSDHPSIDALTAHLDVPDPGVRSHLSGCDDCRGRADRLAGGMALLDEARRLTPVPPPWERMDEALAKEAEAVARDLRSGKLRPAPRVSSWVAAGFAVAAGVGLLIGGRAWMQRHETPAVAPIAHRPAPAVNAVEALPAYEGRVILAAGGAQYREGGAAAGVPLARGTNLREGGSVETGATARAVFTVQSGWTADVRGGSSLQLAELRSTKTAVALERGELALAPAAGESEAVQVRHGGWTVEAHGPVVARAETGVLRVVVLAGRTDVRRGEGETLSVTGPLVVELPLDGGAPRQVTAGVEDANAIDLSMFDERGSWFEIPTIDPSATLTLMGHGALPSALEAVRLSGPGTIQARIGRTEMRLALGGTGALRWAAYHAPTGVVALNRPHVTPVAAASTDTMPDDGAMRAVTSSASAMFRRCISTCQARGHCQEAVTGRIEVRVAPDGRASILSAPAVDPIARRCFDAQAPFIHGRPWQNAYEFAIPISTGTR